MTSLFATTLHFVETIQSKEPFGRSAVKGLSVRELFYIVNYLYTQQFAYLTDYYYYYYCYYYYNYYYNYNYYCCCYYYYYCSYYYYYY